MRIFRARFKIDEPGTISHVTQRAPGREMLFLEEADYVYMLSIIKDIARKFELEIFSFALLPNHLHLFFRQLNENLREAMKNLYERYAKYFNGKYERKGHVFCGPYRQSVCLNDSYFLAVTIYIHNNPVKAGLISNPFEYRWSSVRPYVMPTKVKTYLNYRFVLDMLSKDTNNAYKIYKKLLIGALNINAGNVLENSEAMESYRVSLNKIIDKYFRKKISDLSGFDIEIDKKVEELRSKKRLRNPQEKEARRYLIQQLLSRGYRIAEIAKKLEVSRQSIYKIGLS